MKTRYLLSMFLLYFFCLHKIGFANVDKKVESEYGELNINYVDSITVYSNKLKILVDRYGDSLVINIYKSQKLKEESYFYDLFEIVTYLEFYYLFDKLESDFKKIEEQLITTDNNSGNLNDNKNSLEYQLQIKNRLIETRNKKIDMLEKINKFLEKRRKEFKGE